MPHIYLKIEIYYFNIFSVIARESLYLAYLSLNLIYVGAAPRQPSQTNSGNSNVGQGAGTNQQQYPQTNPVNNQVRI